MTRAAQENIYDGISFDPYVQRHGRRFNQFYWFLNPADTTVFRLEAPSFESETKNETSYETLEGGNWAPILWRLPDNIKNQTVSPLSLTEKEITSGVFSLSEILRIWTAQIQERSRTPLSEALIDLRDVKDEALEEGFPEPSGLALENAERLLKEMYALNPRRFEVYPTPDGEVAIDAPGGHGRSVLLLCASDGSALCLVNMGGVHRRAWYRDTRLLPDGFVQEALEELTQQLYRAA